MTSVITPEARFRVRVSVLRLWLGLELELELELELGLKLDLDLGSEEARIRAIPRVIKLTQLFLPKVGCSKA